MHMTVLKHLEFFTLYEWHPTDEIVFLERTADKPRNDDYCHRSQARQRNGRPARRNQNLIFFLWWAYWTR